VRITVDPGDAEIASIVERGIGTGACNIISGLRTARVCERAFTICRTRGARIGLFAEAGDPAG